LTIQFAFKKIVKFNNILKNVSKKLVYFWPFYCDRETEFFCYVMEQKNLHSVAISHRTR